MSLYQEACKYIPGGVNSPVRAFRGVGGEPIFFKKAAGSRIPPRMAAASSTTSDPGAR